MSKKKETVGKELDKLSQMNKKIEAFKDLLDSLDEIDSKKKILWKEIYDNAVNDRNLADMLFTDSWQRMNGQNALTHESIGSTMAKYLERMCKSNEQILRLAELIHKAEEKAGKIDSDELFNEIMGE
jgi:uncharacterized protein Yka (UPF0111/DUF47 family)